MGQEVRDWGGGVKRKGAERGGWHGYGGGKKGAGPEGWV